MKGKRIDSEFLSTFIENCIVENKNTTDEILAEAKTQISDIDKKIIEVEKLKIKRSKLLDVVFTFDKPKDIKKANDAKILPLFKVANQNICKFICDKILVSPVKIHSIIDNKFQKSDIVFCIKQLLEVKVLARSGELLIKGDMFSEFNKYILHGE